MSHKKQGSEVDVEEPGDLDKARVTVNSRRPVMFQTGTRRLRRHPGGKGS